MPDQYFSVIQSNKELSKNIYKISFSEPVLAESCFPGQFVHVKCSPGYNPLLRRPFSVQAVDKGIISIIYRVIGKGTVCLSKMKKGQILDVLGPLGRQFEILKNKKIIIVAGGIGIAPVSFLSHFIIEKKVPIIDNIEVIWGVKTKEELVLQKQLESLGTNMYISTEDGTCGEKGFCLSPFLSVLEKEKKHDCAVYASGPLNMLKEVSKICGKRKIPAQVSCESIMACGVGACMGCVIKTKEGFKKVCKDGPVFDAGFIKWD